MPRLYPKQARAILSPARYTIIEASVKSGKTAGCLIWLFMLAWNGGGKGRNYWWVAPIFPQAKIAFNRLKRMLLRSDPRQHVWRANQSELRIELINGAQIWFKGADKPDSLYGDDVYGAVIDEGTRVKELAWIAVRTTLTATRGPVKIIGNVRGRKNWVHKLGKLAEGGEADMAYFRLTAYDAVEGGILDRSEVEDARRKLPAKVFDELFLAQPNDDGSNPFGVEAIRRCIKPLSTKPAKVFGVDLAKSHDWTVACGLDDEGTCCRLERWQSDWGQTRRRVVEIIGHAPALIDSTGVGDPIVEDLIRERPNVTGFKFTSNSKQQLMEGLASSIQRQQVGYPEGWLVNELEVFEFTYYAGGVKYSAPAELFDDGVCGLALADYHRNRLHPVDIRITGVGGEDDAPPRDWETG